MGRLLLALASLLAAVHCQAVDPLTLQYERIQSDLDRDLSSNPLYLVTGATCSLSRGCLEFLDENRVQYDYQAWEDHEAPMMFLMAVEPHLPSWRKRKLPRAFLCGEYIGNSNQVKQYHASGELQRAMADCDAYRRSRGY